MPRSEVVTVATLSKSIDKAVALAAKRYGVTLGNETILHRWDLVGRVIREMSRPTASMPLDVASAIAKGAGLKGTPVATKIGKDILVGVIARDLSVRF